MQGRCRGDAMRCDAGSRAGTTRRDHAITVHQMDSLRCHVMLMCPSRHLCQVGAAFGPASSRVAALWYWASCTTDNALYAILFPHYLERTLMFDLGR